MNELNNGTLLSSINIIRNKNPREGEELFKLKDSFVMRISGKKILAI